MKYRLLILLLLLAANTGFAQPTVSVGIKAGNRIGCEAGIGFGNRVMVKVIGQSDYKNPRLRGFKEHLTGENYYLMYGGGFAVRIVGPFWLGLNAGYAWKGEYAYDNLLEQQAVKYQLKGLDVGIELTWNYFEYGYVSLSYDTMPAGFKTGVHVHNVMAGIGFLIPLETK